MAYCPIDIKGIVGDCDSSKGGIKAVYIANYQENAYSAVTSGGTTQIDGFNTVEGGEELKFYKYESAKDTSTLTSTLNVDLSNGVRYI